MSRYLLLAAALACLSACMVVTDEESSPYGRIGIAVPANTVDLSQWQAPQQLGEFSLQGSLNSKEQDLHLFRYVHPARPADILELAVYPLPGGWEDLAPIRVVEGHFPQPREAEMQRLMRHSQADVREILHDSQSDPSLRYPIAISEMRAVRIDRPLGSVLMLTADLPVFLRLRLETDDPAPAQQIPALRQMLLDFRAALARHGGS